MTVITHALPRESEKEKKPQPSRREVQVVLSRAALSLSFNKNFLGDHIRLENKTPKRAESHLHVEITINVHYANFFARRGPNEDL